MEIINVPEPLASVMYSCEVVCIAGCCGLDAFDIRPHWIRRWLEGSDQATLDTAHRQIEELIEYLALEERDVAFPLLNTDGSCVWFIQILHDWKVAIEQAPTSPLPIISQPETKTKKFRREAREALWGCACLCVVAIPIVIVVGLIYWLLGFR